MKDKPRMDPPSPKRLPGRLRMNANKKPTADELSVVRLTPDYEEPARDFRR